MWTAAAPGCVLIEFVCEALNRKSMWSRAGAHPAQPRAAAVLVDVPLNACSMYH